MNSSESFFGSAIPTATFKEINDEVRGKVVGVEVREQRDIDTGEILRWQDGRPKQMAIVLLETHEPTDEDDSGLHNLYVRGYMQNDIRTALRAIHVQGLSNGMWLAVRLDTIDPPKKKGLNGARHFEAQAWDDETPDWAKNWPPKYADAGVGHIPDEDDSEGPPPF